MVVICLNARKFRTDGVDLVVEGYSRRILGWRLSPRMHTALGDRRVTSSDRRAPGAGVNRQPHQEDVPTSITDALEELLADAVDRPDVGQNAPVASHLTPVVVHPWLGPLYWHRARELVGSVDIDPDIRPPRANGDQDAEILVEVGTIQVGAGLWAHLDGCAALVRRALVNLSSIRRDAVAQAPAWWLEHYSAESGGRLVDLLFLDGLEIDPDHRVSVVFDFGDLDSLVVRLDDQARTESVYLRG